MTCALTRESSSCTRLIAVALVGVLAGCSTGDAGSVDSPYAEMFAQARELATSQFERDVLADDQITRAEYEEALQRYVSCIEDQGARVTLQDQAGYYVYAIGGDVAAYDEAAAECALGTNALIEGLYVDILSNPENKNMDEVIAQCFVDAGLVEAPFTSDDFTRLLQGAGAVFTGEDEDSGRAIDPAAEAIMAREEAGLCMANPSYYRTLDVQP